MSAMVAGYLNQGDYLVVDNASVHVAKPIRVMLHDLLVARGVILVFLPAYSPELNPIELIFANVKRYLREYRVAGLPLWIHIAGAFASITNEDLLNVYRHCLVDGVKDLRIKGIR